jgi:hypothetical protein
MDAAIVLPKLHTRVGVAPVMIRAFYVSIIERKSKGMS